MASPVGYSVASTSFAQQDAWNRGTVAEPEQVTDRVWAVPVPIPHGSLPATLSYLLEGTDGSLHVVDPGWEGEEAFDGLKHTMESIGFSLDQVSTVIATHFHPDHLGLASLLRERAGASIVLSNQERRVLHQETHIDDPQHGYLTSQLDRWGVPPDRREEIRASFRRSSDVESLIPDVEVNSGDVLEVPGHWLEVIVTPGHTSGHLCLVDRERNLLYTGDHILPEIFSGVGLGSLVGTLPLDEYLSSVEGLEPFDDFHVLPGHEYRFRGLRTRRHAIISHHLRRSREIEALIPVMGQAPVWEYASHLTWTAGWEGLREFWLYSALRQTDMHREFVVSGRAAPWLHKFPSSE